MAKIKAKEGKKKEEVGLSNPKVVGSLIKSFRASAKGCGRPINPGLLGPFRSCIRPKTLRSKRVKKAIATKARRGARKGII